MRRLYRLFGPRIDRSLDILIFRLMYGLTESESALSPLLLSIALSVTNRENAPNAADSGWWRSFTKDAMFERQDDLRSALGA